jgi:flagellar basal-body rod modification protein FlgD
MEIAPTGPAATAATPKRGAGEPKDATATAADTTAGDFETFLSLLTTQLRNQDPLKPTESTEFVSQLATFSGVEQQVRTNDQLASILQALGGGASAGLADWIGREVRAPARAGFTGVPIAIEATPLAGADRSLLVVTNDFGEVVARRAIEPGATRVAWDGRDELGQGMPYGEYWFTVESYADDALLGASPGQTFGRVTEVRLEDGAPTLVLDGGARVLLADVTALR